MVHSLAAKDDTGNNKDVSTRNIDIKLFFNLFKYIYYLYLGPDVCPGFSPTSSLVEAPESFFASLGLSGFTSSAGDEGALELSWALAEVLFGVDGTLALDALVESLEELGALTVGDCVVFDGPAAGVPEAVVLAAVVLG